MSKEKRYWWLKLPEDFFRSKEIRYLKRRTICYLREPKRNTSCHLLKITPVRRRKRCRRTHDIST